MNCAADATGSWRRKALALSLGGLALLAAGCASGTTPPPRVAPTPRPTPAPPDRVVRVQVTENGRHRIVVRDLEDYVVGSILSETALAGLPAVAATHVARLQAVLARTYAVANLGRHAREGFDLCSETHCQVYRPPDAYPERFRSMARAAAAETRGVILAYEGRPIQALFHSDCGGHTSDAGIVWGGVTPPYLLAVPDPVEATHRPWQFDLSAEQLREALNGDARTRVGNRVDRIDVVERDVAGRATRVVIDGERAPMVRGEELRAVLTAAFGARTVKSTRFDVRRDGNRFSFVGTGFGHGVGLCQVGAIARARRGESFVAILGHYYAGARLEHLGRLRLTSRGPGARAGSATP
ncbi:MAG: SpoIID/LytB domain-containing protein [Vicinamibacterales bacterium]|jgi:stage II sporulation protein D|nr:hypothetical protein [Acidobacteriota bacterium]MDP7295325.1 SpoIID/LytB domain-containing protein [Vicinamibacterales bacterium]MDP7471678.1 SpoIID/LytB domain-containing protein [Vicinamibacterales bacterium]MDP7672017.1 SpoIID/LytB domain-containing protein [Vicinamibacterales bacterium]HJO39228.1 SpoIID/LytB domain-containing protein [Vicinamibacterales bacterium]|tara:strand:+ start:1245 stop:2306 length:1062 start_codon:yes stop_codon:yes gene_type:complete